MNKTFLERVAEDLLAKYSTDLSQTAVVFPNKRAALFMNEHLARLAGRPMWSPAYVTISDLFRSHSSLQVADPILLICRLHRIFTQVTGTEETLDHFYGWGQLLLADFDDLDKNMAQAERVFANLRDLHELDDISYLTEEQKALLRRFFGNFTEASESELKHRFLTLWSRFHEIYLRYNATLKEEGLAYEGALYRAVAEDEDIEFNYERYVFVGFNVLQQVEQRLFSRLRKAGKAVFYWDYDHYFKDNPDNEAGHYLREYLPKFPNELADDDPIFSQFCRPKQAITFLAAQTENAQARFVSQWLRREGRIEAGRKTAVVLCDESLLPVVVHCLPTEVEKVNITTGYPLSQSPFASLVSLLTELQTTGHVNGTDKYRLRNVLRTLRHPYAPYITPHYHDLITKLSTEHLLFPTRALLAQDEGCTLLFSQVEPQGSKGNLQLLEYLLQVLRLIGTNAAHEQADPLFQESLFRMYTLLNRLCELVRTGELSVELVTLQRLISQLVGSTSIPFHGEPAEGLQIMGVLETRNLDFDHVLLLSCNEGNMPKGVNDVSFIPYAIRKAYGLTTIDNKVAVYAYYFNRLLQRAQDVTLCYNNATEDGQSGQMSRFMLQLLVESNHPIRKSILSTRLAASAIRRRPIVKDDNIMNLLNEMKTLSPTAINRYLRCQLQFYYHLLADLKEPDQNDDDEIDNRIFGNIFHRSAELIYLRLSEKSNIITKGDIQNFSKHHNNLEIIVDQAFKEELFKTTAKGFSPEYNGLQLINREVIIGFLQQLLKLDEQLAPFTLIGSEIKAFTKLKIPTSNAESTLQESRERELTIGGIIDRLDLVHTQTQGDLIRVLDYKTGRTATQSVADVADIFSGENITQKHADYYLQAMLYASIVSHSAKLNPNELAVAPALLFIQHAGGDDYNPILTIGTFNNRLLLSDIRAVEKEFMERLTTLISEMLDKSVPFTPTADTTRCQNCPYRQICGL